eukprot:TRINITY_DN14601_c0_g2_i3.p1 TRINITY_DN14601_c0_g2~~TRINITY_DN14601_c0_g2_i3.p1  ORF type:complete len:595 (-),score=134.57 TRINITY_DN14601_c0_g2_i3:723-2507(-)
MILRCVVLLSLFGLIVFAQEANNTASSGSDQQVQAPKTEELKPQGNQQDKNSTVDNQISVNATDTEKEIQSEDNNKTEKSTASKDVSEPLDEKNNSTKSEAQSQEKNRTQKSTTAQDVSEPLDEKNSTKQEPEAADSNVNDDQNSQQSESNTTNVDKVEKNTPKSEAEGDEKNSTNSETSPENKVEKNTPKSEAEGDEKNSTKTETSPEITDNNDTSIGEDLYTSNFERIDSENSSSKNEPGGYEEFYNDFSFDELFENDYDYFGYDYFGQDYFDLYNEEKQKEEDNQDFMYQNLYQDYYEYFYEDESYADYEYYGDYGYYGVYNEEGYKYEGYSNNDESQEGVDQYEYLVDYFSFHQDYCQLNEKGEIVLDVAMDICNITVSGADELVQNLDGGLDGVYQLAGCENERPKYVRYEKPGQERILWWSSVFGDWDFTAGDKPNNDDILLYGGDTLNEERPNFVVSWHVATDILSQQKAEDESQKDYIPIDLKITCTNGTQLERPQHAQMGNQPLLTDNEMEFQYRMIYERYGKRELPTPQINFSLVVVMVFVGMGVVLGIPYMVVKRGGGKGRSAWAQSKEQAYVEQRKKRVGKD